MRYKTLVTWIALSAALLAAPVCSHAIVVWDGGIWESETGNIIVYNDTDAKVTLVSDDWGHEGLLDPPNPMEPHSAKADLDCNLRDEDRNHGNLIFKIKDDEGEYTFLLWAHTDPHGKTWFQLRSDHDFRSDGVSSSGAVGIDDDGWSDDQRVAQLYREASGKSPGYVVSFYACANKDQYYGKYTGNTRIILYISRNDPGRFNQYSVNSKLPSNWNPYH